jgi:hypothetical protein
MQSSFAPWNFTVEDETIFAVGQWWSFHFNCVNPLNTLKNKIGIVI